jgi:hypothetical protein
MPTGAPSASLKKLVFAKIRLNKQMRVIAGYLCILIGIAGVLLPIVPGIPFFFLAAHLLGWDHWLIKPFADRLRAYRASTGRKSQPDHAAENDACPALPGKSEPPQG